MQGIPGSPPPGTYAPGNNDLGPQAGNQAKESWTVSGQREERQLLSAMRAPHMWRVTLHGENVTFRVSWGTSSNIVVANVLAPARFSVPGSCDVYAKPVGGDPLLPAHAEVTLTPATSSGGDAVLHSHVAGNVVALDPNAARFFALVASVVSVGPAATAVNLNPLQSVLLAAGSVLTSGGGFLEFEP